MMRRYGWLLGLVLGGVLCATLAGPPRPLLREAGEVPVLVPRAEVLRVLGAPVLPMVVDYYWLQTIQQVGRAKTAREYRDIYPYANLVSDLDPNFRQIYAFAGAIIPFPVGGGRFVNTEESTRLMEKGVRHVPDHVMLRILLAYNYSTFHGRFRDAAEQLSAASRIPGAPYYVGALAARLYARAGQVDAGLLLAQQLAEQAEDPETRELFERRVKELKLERVLEKVDAAVVRYRAREGRLPPDVATLIRAKDLPGVPPDPFGGTIILDAQGRARSSVHSRRASDIGGLPASPEVAP